MSKLSKILKSLYWGLGLTIYVLLIYNLLSFLRNEEAMGEYFVVLVLVALIPLYMFIIYRILKKKINWQKAKESIRNANKIQKLIITIWIILSLYISFVITYNADLYDGIEIIAFGLIALFSILGALGIPAYILFKLWTDKTK